MSNNARIKPFASLEPLSQARTVTVPQININEQYPDYFSRFLRLQVTFMAEMDALDRLLSFFPMGPEVEPLIEKRAISKFFKLNVG